MKKIIVATVITLLAANVASAKTYTLKSGKWTDPNLWGDDYPGTTIVETDQVIVTGMVVMDVAVTVEGTLQVEKGASMVGLSELQITATGKFINNGNTVVEKILNEGSVVNNMSMEALNDIENKGTISNASNMTAGNDFNNSGVIEGKKSTYFIQNNLVSNSNSKFGNGVRVFYGGANVEEQSIPAPAITEKRKAEQDSLRRTLHSNLPEN